MPLPSRLNIPFRLLGTALLAIFTVAGAAQASAEDDAQERQALAETRNACTQQDFSTFLQYYIASSAVRQQHTAPQVEQRSFAQPQKTGQMIPASQARPFRVGQIDWYYADAASLDRWAANPDDRYQLLDVTITELPGGGRKLVYQPGVFRDDGEGDSLTLVRRSGKPAAYVFAAHQGCWQLTQDLR